MQKQNNSLIILLSILLFTSLVIAGFFAYQTQQLVNELRVMRDELKQTPASTPDPTTDWKTYTNEKYGYSLNIPATWTIDDSGTIPDKVIAHFYNNTDQIGLLNEDLTITSDIGTIESYLKRTANNYPQEKIDQYKIGNLKGTMVIVEGNGNTYGHHYIISNNNVNYEIGFISLIKFDSSYDQILSTFKFSEELQKGWYWGDANQKKTNTPSDWVFEEAGRSSCWHEVGTMCQ